MNENDLEFLNSLAFACLGAGIAEPTRPVFELVAAQRPFDAAGPIGLAAIAMCHGRHDEAIHILRGDPVYAKINAHEARKVLLNALVFSNRLVEAGELHRTFMHFDAANDERGYIQESEAFFGRHGTQAG